MIKNIIFDFGDVFVNLDKQATLKAFEKLGISEITKTIQQLHEKYEIGKITTNDFINKHIELYPDISKTEFIKAWNAIILDFPLYRLEYLEKMALEKKYKLILLSNTNELHINHIKENISFYPRFKSCFDQFYLSHEIHLRKPNTNIFEFILKTNQLLAEETLFIDDTTENTTAASILGIHVWNNDPKKEDITELYTKKSNLF